MMTIDVFYASVKSAHLNIRYIIEYKHDKDVKS